MIVLSVNKQVTPVFYANKEALENPKYDTIANQGSTRSSKTYSIMQLLIMVALSGKTQISCVSISMPHLKKGCRKDFLEIMNDWGLYSDSDFNKTDNIYKFPNTGATIEFFSADDDKKVRGSNRDILYVNEANLLSHDTYRQLALRTRGKKIIDYNPADEFNYVYDIAAMPSSKFIKSTYKNNLKFLTDSQIREIENLNPEINPSTGDANLWKVFGLGERGSSEATIYTHWTYTNQMPTHGEVIYGQDFGYNNPSALIKLVVNDNGVYACEMFYETKLTTDDIIDYYKELDISKYDPIYADTEGDRIEQIQRAGYNIRAASKQVELGINYVKSRPLKIYKGSVNLIKEIKSYKWKQKLIGGVDFTLDEPVKVRDHAMDALRYAAYTHYANPISKPTRISLID